MKALLISSSFPRLYCGVGDYVYKLANSLTSQGVKVLIVTSCRKEIIDFGKAKEAQIFNIYPDIKIWDQRAINHINDLISVHKPECVHLHYHWWMYNDGFPKGKAFIQIYQHLQKKGFKGKLITTFVHDLMGPYLFPKAELLRRIFFRRLVNYSDHIIVHTESAKQQMYSRFPLLTKKIHRIPCGAGISASSNTSETKNKEFTISFFGFVYPQKGLEYLIEALSILKTDNIQPILWIIGGKNIDHVFNYAYANKLRQEINDKGLNQQVKWFDYQDEEQVSTLLNASTISVLPFTEGISDISSSLPTILDHRLPLVTTQSNFTSQYLVNEKNCLLVPPCNSHALAKAIECLYNSLRLRQKIADNARKLYEQEYCWDVIAKKIYDIYKS